MLFEVFPEKRLVGEIQVLRDFLDALSGIAQEHSDFKRYVIVNPFVGCAPTDLLDGFGKIFGRDAHLLSVPVDTPLVPEVFLDK